MKKIVLVSGGFDPIHSGHIQYFKSARELGDELWVAINSDMWLTRKKGQAFMSFAERKIIIENLKMVDQVISFDDADDTAIDAINKVKERNSESKIIFANGGDRTKENSPEQALTGVDFVFGVGGEHKINSSSVILENWRGNLLWQHYF